MHRMLCSSSYRFLIENLESAERLVEASLAKRFLLIPYANMPMRT